MPPARPVGRPKLPTDRIVTTALAIVDADGADALTFRSLAAALGSSTSTLYRHVDSRAALLDQVVERLFEDLDVDALLDDPDWVVALSRLGAGLFAAVARHPNAAPLLIGRVPTGPNAMRLREAVLARLLANGFGPDEAQALTASFGRFVIGFAIQARELGGDPIDEATVERLVDADPARYPATRSTATAATVSIVDEFAVALDLMVRGLRDRAAAGDPVD